MIPATINPDTILSSHQVGMILQVNPSSINKWVNDGRIHAFRTPGGHRRIKAVDLLAFLSKHAIPVPAPLMSAAQRRVLVVDDDKKQLNAVERLFKPYEQRVDLVLVDNGIDAMVTVGAWKPHMVIIDVFMPNLDGVEVCRRLRAIEETNKIITVVMTGQLTPELEKQAKQAGARRVVAKPVNVTDLLVDLGLHLEAQAAMQS
ncbi:MAG: response regulator [Deltaproteobacteria bacterium]|nr:response regulator [Deltaproteobacteria bacterium]